MNNKTKNQTKNKNSNRNAHLKAANLISRLPLHKQLSDSQAALVKLAPVWQSWARHAISDSNLSAECFQNTELSSLRDGKLVINCSNAIYASQIKHQQQSLLDAIIKEGITTVEKINIQLNNQLNYQPETLSQQRLKLKQSNNQHAVDSTIIHAPLTENSLNALENCQKLVNNDQLADSLRKLAKTLKKLN